jgi:hypothetical protein
MYPIETCTINTFLEAQSFQEGCAKFICVVYKLAANPPGSSIAFGRIAIDMTVQPACSLTMSGRSSARLAFVACALATLSAAITQ